MALLIRKVERSRWFEEDRDSRVDPEDVPADPFYDLKTSKNVLSFYRMNGVSVGRVVAALAATRHNVQEFDVITVEESVLCERGLEIRESDGTTEDPEVNKCHVDLINLTGKKLVRVVRAILDAESFKLHNPKAVAELIYEAVESKRIPKTKLSNGVWKSVLTKTQRPDIDSL